MNLLIADSGSTKTDWVHINSEKKKTFYSSEGLNPYFSTKEYISKTITESIATELKNQEVEKIIFYGSGTGAKSKAAVLENCLKENFPNAEIKVDTDLKAAAVACFGNKKGLACILGTGSGACLYDGEEITKKAPSLGFVLGDEGSAGYIGKQILSSYYHKTLPDELQRVIDQSSNMNLDLVLQKVYEEPQANRYVASFIKVLSDHRDHAYLKEIVKTGFEIFADKQLRYFKESASLEIGIVGSIAFIYKDVLEEVLDERGMNLGTVVHKPLENLVQFHQ